MPNLLNSKRAGQEQEETADATERLEKSAEQATRERGAANPLEQAVKQQTALQDELEKVQNDARELGGKNQKSFDNMKHALTEEYRRPVDSFQSAGPGGASQSQRDDLRQAQQELLDNEQLKEQLEELEQAAKATQEAAKSVEFAAQSMQTRREETRCAVIAGQSAALAETAQADQTSGKFTAAEMTERQREREARVADDVAALMKNQTDEISRVAKLLHEIQKLTMSLVEDLQKGLPQDVAFENRLAQFNEKCERALAEAVLWYGRLSDIEAVKQTWEKASRGLENTPKGFAKARETFWGMLNEGADEDAKRCRRLFEHLGVEWQQGTNAPLLAVESRRIKEMREGAEHDEQMRKWYEQEIKGIRISVDHAADKKANDTLTLAASNLRLMTQSDNSARGNSYGVSERWKANLEKSSEEVEDSAEKRDHRRGKSAEKSHDRQEVKTFGVLQQQIAERQARAASNRSGELKKANESFETEALELRDLKLRPLDGETEGARSARQEKLREVLSQFHNAEREQLKELHASETRLEALQKVELQKAQLSASAQSSAVELLKLEKAIQARFARDQIERDALRREMNICRNENGARMLEAIYAAATLKAQQEAIERAVAQQQETVEQQNERREALDRKRHAHEPYADVPGADHG